MGSKKAKKKFYVVWIGKKPGVYENWADCQAATAGFPGAKFKAFPTQASAEEAFEAGHSEHWGVTSKFVTTLSQEELQRIGMPIVESLCVDAAWNAQSKVMEYQGVWMENKELVFHQGPFSNGTNNIGEFLAVVHALAWLARKGMNSMPIYTDSETAISWLRRRKCNSKSVVKGETGDEVNDLIRRAEKWIQSNSWDNRVLKWETQAWGEIPADFGRK